MKDHIQTRVRQPLGLIEIIDRNPQAIEDYPDTHFVRDGHGLLYRVHPDRPPPPGEDVYGGSYSLFTRVWLGLAPPTGREPGYCAVVGEVFESHLPRFEACTAHLRPVFLLDEVSEILMPRLLTAATNLKDVYLPYVDRADIAGKINRHDPEFRLLVWPQEELLEDVQNRHYGLTGYPDEEDLDQSRVEAKWPRFQSRHHIAPPMLPPYREDPERLYAIVDAMMESRTHDGQPLFGVHQCCTQWIEGQQQTPHMAVAMVCAALQRHDWAERINLDVLEDYHDELTDDEMWEAMNETADYIESLRNALLEEDEIRTLCEAENRYGYRKLLGLPEEETPEERAAVQDLTAPGGQEMVIPQ